jgi:hypothetical protein
LAVRRTRRRRGAALRGGWAAIIALLLAAVWSPFASASDASATRFDDLEILAVDEGDPIRIVFAAPSQLATRTLTEADLDVRIDGEAQRRTLQRLSANDLEIAVVVDTTLGAPDIRTLQGAFVELALELPQGASMRIVDAEGNATDPAAVPGPAIAAIRGLRADTGDDLAAAVRSATSLLDESTRGRTALFVVGRDLPERIDPVDERPLDSLAFLIDIGDGGNVADLVGPQATGKAMTVPTVDGVLEASNDISTGLRSLYLVEIPAPDAAAGTVTLAVSADEGASSDITVTLDPSTLRPSLVDLAANEPAADDPPVAQDAEPATTGGSTADGSTTGGWVPLVLVTGIPLAALAAFAVSRAFPRGPATSRAFPRGPATTRPAVVESADPLPEQPVSPVYPRQRRPGEKAARRQRPIAKLAPETREALARAHLGLRQLALASRDTKDMIPDDMFRLSEARASAALDGHDHTLGVVLLSMLTDDTQGSIAMVRRAADALSTGWQHTAQSSSAPPAVVEINALLRGESTNGYDGPRRPVTPVRALNPLVEIGLEHMVLAAGTDEHAGLVARAVTAVDIMRAARLARPVLTISPYLLSDAARYRAACAADPTDAAERDDWLQFLCDAITRRSHVSVEQLNRLRRIRARYRDAASDLPAARLVEVLLARPVVDVAHIARRLALPEDEAAAVAAKAEQVGWLAPHPDDERAWVAEDVLEAFASTADVTSGSRQPV